MHPVEITQTVVVLAAAIRLVLPWRHHPAAIVIAVILPTGLAATQIAMTGWRWQMAVLTAASVLVVGAALADMRRNDGTGRLLGLSGGLLGLAGMFAAWALPVADLPAPTGGHPVGISTAWFADPERGEQWGPATNGPRRVTAHVWYPAVDSPAPPAAWLADDQLAAAIAESFGLPRVLSSHLGDITGHAVRDAPVATDGGPYPLLIFSHGWSGFSALHSSHFESLASHGWIVVALDHTYASLITLRADGEVARLEPTILPDPAEIQAYAEAARGLVATFAADIELAFAQFPEQLDPDLVAAIDPYLTAIGGHSTGGGAAILACSRNRWCDAVVGFDPWVEPVPDEVIGSGLAVPLLSIRSAEWVALPNDQRLRRLHAGSSAVEGRIAIANTVHRDFTIVPLLSPLIRWNGNWTSTADAQDTLSIVDEWTRQFLDRHVRDRGVDPLQRPPADPRVTVSGN
ncbi:MAG: hypothetical protein WD007_06450 [Nitriliruptoraceae bacterium]